MLHSRRLRIAAVLSSMSAGPRPTISVLRRGSIFGGNPLSLPCRGGWAVVALRHIRTTLRPRLHTLTNRRDPLRATATRSGRTSGPPQPCIQIRSPPALLDTAQPFGKLRGYIGCTPTGCCPSPRDDVQAAAAALDCSASDLFRISASARLAHGGGVEFGIPLA